MPVPELYRMCEVAYELAVEGLGLGRVIARPFRGAPGAFVRTPNRHDYAMPPTGETLLDRLTAAGVPVIAIGKIADLFARRGITRAVPTPSDEAGMDAVGSALRDEDAGLVFANLVDFDTQYGHRNDVAGLRAKSRAVRPPVVVRPAAAAPDGPARDHRRPRQRPDDAEHRSFARARAAAGRRARA